MRRRLVLLWLLGATAGCSQAVVRAGNSGGGSSDPGGDGRGEARAIDCGVRGALANLQAGCGSLGAGQAPSRIRYRGRELYLSGFNVAWFRFAQDFGSGVPAGELRKALADLVAAGGNTLRWWVHTDGTASPQWAGAGGERRVTGLGARFVEDLRGALDIAAESGVYLVPSLWSFDMLRDNDERDPPTADNYRLLADDGVLQSYLDSALVPLVQALNGHPALIAWELFNEPENMTESWFAEEAVFYGGEVPSLERLQRVQAKMAAAIHRAALEQGEVALVTTGSKSLGKYNSDAAGGVNLYRDDRMIAAAGGDKLATFDFYAPHYYENEGKRGIWSPFHHSAAHWKLDKPIVVGEFHSNEDLAVLGERVRGSAMCQRLASGGYAGGWPWQWNEYPAAVSACVRKVSLASP